MINLPEVIDAIDIFKYEDADGIDKIASKINNDAMEIPFEEDVRHLKMQDFACIIKTANGNLYKFPINTKDNTELNINAFIHTKKNLPDEIVKVAGANLIKAGKFWGLDTSEIEPVDSKTNIVNLEKINEKAYLEKMAIPVENREYKVFALENQYPIDTPELMKQAEVYYTQYEHLFDPVEQYQFATNMIKQAKAINYNIKNRKLIKYANLRYEKNPDLEQLLIARDSKTTTDRAYREVIKVANKVPLEKLAEAIYDLDKEFGYDKFYNKSIPDPIFTVFAAFEKTAETIQGKPISTEILRSIDKETLKGLSLTDETIDDLYGEQGVEVLRSLPEPVIDQIVNTL